MEEIWPGMKNNPEGFNTVISEVFAGTRWWHNYIKIIDKVCILFNINIFTVTGYRKMLIVLDYEPVGDAIREQRKKENMHENMHENIGLILTSVFSIILLVLLCLPYIVEERNDQLCNNGVIFNIEYLKTLQRQNWNLPLWKEPIRRINGIVVDYTTIGEYVAYNYKDHGLRTICLDKKHLPVLNAMNHLFRCE